MDSPTETGGAVLLRVDGDPQCENLDVVRDLEAVLVPPVSQF
jgi:hypothetical protein